MTKPERRNRDVGLRVGARPRRRTSRRRAAGGAHAGDRPVVRWGRVSGATGLTNLDHAPRRRGPLPGLLRRREGWVLLLLVLTVGAVGAWDPSFLSAGNAMDILADAAPAVVIACAVTLVVVTGEIDISVGSLLGLCAAVMGLLCYGDEPAQPVAVGVAAAVGLGLCVGLVNGGLVTLGRVPSIIVTLGMLTALRGATKLVMAGSSIEGRPEPLRALATGTALGVPISVWVAGAAVVLTTVLARATPLGLRIYAVGSNAAAAPLAGVHVGRTKLVVFALSGLFTGVAAVLLAPRNSLIQPNVGEGMELLVVTCVVVGGTSISGGVGTVAGTVLAVLLLATVPTILTYVKAPPQWRLAIQGGFILAAVLADHLFRGTRPQGAHE
jgi:rhamnose transport system permease protein